MPPKAPSGGDRPVANKHAIVSTVEYQRFIEHRWKLLWISAVTWWSVLSLVALLVWCGIAVHGDGVATHAHDEHLPSPGHVFLWNVTWYLVVPLACWSAATLLALASFKSKKWFDNVMRTDTPSLDFRDSRTAEDGGERLARDAWLVFAWPANVVLLGIFGKASVAERYRLGRTLRSRERELAQL